MSVEKFQGEGLGLWQFLDKEGGREAILWLAQSDEEQRRRFYHDYIAAVRTLRYLAQKGLKTLASPEAAIDPAKQSAFDKHLKNLEAMQARLIDPLFQRPASESSDAP